MHRRAEYGIAAHWGYKEQAKDAGRRPRRMAWLQRIVDWQPETSIRSEFLETLKLDLDTTRSTCSRPRARVIALPAGSTPIDFAYAIHTEVGHRCIGAKVNGRLVPLDTKLAVGRHGRDHHLQGPVGRAVAGLAEDRGLPPGPQQDPPVVQPGTA